MLKVLIEPNSILDPVTGNKNGRDYCILQQKVRIFQPGSSFPDSFNIVLPKGVQSYPPGEYIWDISADIIRSSFDSPSLSRSVKLIPLTVENVNNVLATLKSSFNFENSSPKPLFEKKAA